MTNATGARLRQASVLLAIAMVTAGAASVVRAEDYAGLTSASEMVVVIQDNANISETLMQLAAAGYSTTEPLPQLGPRARRWRRLVGPNTAATRAQLMNVPGVSRIMPVFRPAGSPEPIFSTGQIITRFKPATPLETASAVAAAKGCRIVRQFTGLPQAFVLEPIAPDADLSGIVNALGKDTSVLYSQPSIFLKMNKHQVAGNVIEDPLYPFQWHLKNTQQLSGGLTGADINVEEAWQTTLGAGAIVGVVDDCVQRDHEDLADNYLTGLDTVGDGLVTDGDPSPFYGPQFGDPVGDFHGTSVAGLIVGSANRLGGRGVAPQAKLVGCKIGLGFIQVTDQDIVDVFLFCERNGVMVINNSWGGPGGALLSVIPNSFLISQIINDVLDQISTQGRAGRGVLVMFSSGNDSLDIAYGNYLNNHPAVMSIGATMRDDTLSCYSNFGNLQSVVAPGGGVLFGCYDSDMTTTDVAETPCYSFFDFDLDGALDPGFPCRGVNPPMKFLSVLVPNGLYPCPDPNDLACVPLVTDTSISDFPQTNYTHHFNGTSSACPVAAGVAALVFSVNTGLTAAQVRNLMEHTADRPAVTNARFDTVTGFNYYYGHGRVNAARAVRAATLGQTWPSPVKDIQNVSSQALARLFWTNPPQDVASVLVVRGTGSMLDWAPEDGINYTVGQTVAPGVTVVANDVIEQLDQTGLDTNNYQYALFVRNGNSFYSWGRRTSFSATSPVNTPVVSAIASPRTGNAPLPVRFTGGTTKPLEAVAYVWDFGDGTVGTGSLVDHTYTKGGSYTAKLTVTNKAGLQGSTTVIVNVVGTPNALPTVAATATPTSGNAPLIVVFRATATDSDGQVVSYSWNFGDGSTGTGPTVEHIYLVPGTYAAVLTVTDNSGGQNYASQTILVGGTAPTAAATDPPNLLTPITGLCGAGVAPAAAISLVSLMLVTRRRRF